MVDSTEKQMLYVTFNQDGSCFALGTEDGFGIYNSNPFKDNFFRNLNGGIAIIEMLERSNIIALVGGGTNPKFDSNTVIIWDDHQGKVMTEIRLSSNIKSVKLKRERIIIVTERKIFVLAFVSLIVIDTIDTCENPSGIITVAQDPYISMIAYPGQDFGCVMVKNYKKDETVLPISAHQNKLNCLALNNDGTLLATSSEMGTMIRLFNTNDGTMIKELRLGAERADIYSISFDYSSKYLACSSNRKKIFIFAFSKVNDNDNSNENNGESDLNPSVLKKISFFFKIQPHEIDNTEIAFAQFQIDDDKAICSFGNGLDLFVISSGGKYYHITFDAKYGGKCVLLSQKDLLNHHQG